ncbi:hypothetical protein [Sinomonas soli]
MSSAQQTPPPPPPSAGDYETEKLLKKSDASLLSDVRSRADKWSAGLTALTGLLTTALLVKGPEGILDVPEPFRVLVAVLISIALLLLIIATLLIYSAAYGSPTGMPVLSRQLSGLQVRYMKIRESAAKSAFKSMQIAIGLTVLAVFLLFGTTMFTWFAKSGSSQVVTGACIQVDGVTIKLGELQAVDGRRQLAVVPCPA